MSERSTRSEPRGSLFPLGFENAYLAPTKYLHFEQQHNPGRKTSVWTVFSRSSGDPLGRIAWYGAWRQYCFFPARETLYNTDCLAAITDRVQTCNRWQRNVREHVKAAS